MPEESLTERQNSIEVSKGMNDKYSWKIKYYFENETDSNDIIDKIKKDSDKLKEEFESE